MYLIFYFFGFIMNRTAILSFWQAIWLISAAAFSAGLLHVLQGLIKYVVPKNSTAHSHFMVQS